MNYSIDLKTITQPYIIRGGNLYTGAIFKYEVCEVVENYLNKLMNAEPYPCAVSYCDYCVDGHRIEGVMTITIVGEDYVPDIFTLIYERKSEG